MSKAASSRDDKFQSLLTIPDVADLCRVNKKTVRRWIGRHELPAFKLGRQWRIAERDLRRFLNERWQG